MSKNENGSKKARMIETPPEARIDPAGIFGDPVKRGEELASIRAQRAAWAHRVLELMGQLLKHSTQRDKAASPEVGDHAISQVMKPLEHAKATYKNLTLYEDALVTSIDTDSVLVVASRISK